MLVEVGAVSALGQAVEVGEHVQLHARILPALLGLAHQVGDERLGMHLLLDVQGRHVDHQVGEVLLVLAAPHQLGIQVAVATLVGFLEERFLLLAHHGLVLGGGDVGAGVILVAQGFHGGFTAAVPGPSGAGHALFSPVAGVNGFNSAAPSPSTSATFRVTSTRLCTIAVAANRPSITGIGRMAQSRPHLSATTPSTANMRLENCLRTVPSQASRISACGVTTPPGKFDAPADLADGK